jgi:uncharacterized protein (DUF1697 family)
VALLRGINVGRAKRVAMADLRSLFESLGYRDVRTLLNSGNVVFTVPPGAEEEPGPRLEKAILENLGVSSRMTVLTASELAAILAGNPLLEVADHPSRLLVAVLNPAADRTRVEPLARQDWTPDACALGERAVYLWCAQGILESPLAEAVNRALRDTVTTRNWATFTKLGALVQGST